MKLIHWLLAALWLLVPLASFADTPQPATSTVVLPQHAVVASANAQATDAGLEVLRMGGNAFDAAVAVSATLGLVEPESSGLGGGAFMLLHVAKDSRDVFVDAREKAPLAATRDMFLDANGQADRSRSVAGPLAAAIPGLPAGLVHLAQEYGRLPLSKSLAPTIRLAKKGWVFGPKNQTMLGFRKADVAKDPAAAAMFLRNGAPLAVGTRIRNPDYARVLERLARDGADSYYRGEFAKRLVKGVRDAGGIWTEEDLAQYRVVEREPIRIGHRGYEIVTAPPPSSAGAAIAEILHIIDGYDYASMARIPRVHLFVEAMRRAFRDRAIYFGDPDFVKVPLALLLSDDYAAGLRAGINLERAMPSELLPGVQTGPASADTSHFSIIDREGNLAAVTQSVNLPYGNTLMVPGTGFMLNDHMDDFSVKPGVPNAYGLVGEDANAIAPGKRPLSSMSPTFLIGKERVAVLGTPGGSRIVTMVLLALVELMDGRSPQQTAELPRYHHQYLPDTIAVEPGAFDAEEVGQLEARGHHVAPAERPWGNMHIATWDPRTGATDTGVDNRWKGVGKGGSDGDAVFR
ncbi:MAG TPA: gamma-glutamyltransferase [Xanthomonadales bacterium]|nr:gamma-glutamyltransferase [Xanthomonadales bacterium]